MGLQRYREKRDFSVSPEPEGGQSSETKFSYVIQKHAASHVHYDFRLELDGVLLSWAVPKGPSLDPKVRRLAMQTEDHPVEYGSFEGIIPAGEYGGGTVMIWDQGTWEPLEDARKGYAKGHLKFVLRGKKLRGAWHLVRAGKQEDKKKGWLLFKSGDQEASATRSIIEEEPNSAQTGRSIEQIASAGNSVWHSNRAAKSKGAPPPQAKVTPSGHRAPHRGAELAAMLKRGSPGPLPKALEPQRPTLVKQVPVGPEWAHELKYDGYRMLGRLEDGRVTLLTRNGHDWTSKMPTLAEVIAGLPYRTALLDGEIAVRRPDGTTDFQLLQNALGDGPAEEITFFVFDLLYLDGIDLRALPLAERKAILETVMSTSTDRRLQFSQHLVVPGQDFFQAACKLNAEGIVSKRLTQPYRSGKGHDWLKTKCVGRQEFVVGGFTDPGGSRSHFGALLLGLRSGSGGSKLRYAGKVGTGFTEQSLRELTEKMKPLRTDDCPFDNPPRGADARGAHWIEPQLVAEVEFTAITKEGMVRHPSFCGLRLDKAALKVTLERPAKIAVTAPTVVRLTHPERLLYPALGVSKQELADYYSAVSRWMLPHVAHRPLTLVRCPQGFGGQTFFQKHATPQLPRSIRSIPIDDDGTTEQYMAIDDEAGLVGLAQMSVLEIHTWGAHADDPEKPDFLVFDLDPDPAVSWPAVIGCAEVLRQGLTQLKLESYVKTTGGKGLHVCVPIDRGVSWDEAKDFCRGLSELVVRLRPSAYIATMSKSQRKGKIFIDFFRNGRGATFIAPYSTRAREGATVAMPLAWDELSLQLPADHFNIRNAMDRMGRLSADPWKDASSKKQVLSAIARRTVAQPPT